MLAPCSPISITMGSMTLFEPQPATRYVQVALNLPLRREFTYALPPGVDARPGNRVRVHFHGRKLGGVVVGVSDTCDLPPAKVKPIDAVLDQDLLLPSSLLELSRRMAVTYGCSLGEALDATLPAAAKARGQRRIPHLELKAPPDLAQAQVEALEDKHQERARVLRTVLEFGGPMPVLDVRRRTGTSDSPWKTLVKDGLLRRVLIAEDLKELEPSLDERAERHDGRDDALAHLAGLQVVEEHVALFLLVLLEESAARQHHVVAVAVELDDLGLDDLAHVGLEEIGRAHV
mgnify:CR=1 FL=1